MSLVAAYGDDLINSDVSMGPKEYGIAMVWILMIVLYAAPANAVDWKGPWKFGMSRSMDQTFKTEAECNNAATQMIAELHQQMLVPMRSKCVGVEAQLPEGTPR